MIFLKSTSVKLFNTKIRCFLQRMEQCWIFILKSQLKVFISRSEYLLRLYVIKLNIRLYVLNVTSLQICKIHHYYINLQILRNKSAYHYNLNNPFDHNTVSNRSIYTLNKQIWPFTLVHSFKFKNFSRSMCASLDKYLLRSFNYISSREINEILFLQ